MPKSPRFGVDLKKIEPSTTEVKKSPRTSLFNNKSPRPSADDPVGPVTPDILRPVQPGFRPSDPQERPQQPVAVAAVAAAAPPPQPSVVVSPPQQQAAAPAVAVAPVVAVAAAASSSPIMRQANNSPSKGDRCKAVFKYQAKIESELSFQRGDEIELEPGTDSSAPGMWKGRLVGSDGPYLLFPSKYTKK